jgi:hypothetical protein
MPKEKYWNFKVSAPFLRASKQSNDSHQERQYVSISCPYCKETFAEVTAETVAKMKSTKCLAHIKDHCANYNYEPESVSAFKHVPIVPDVPDVSEVTVNTACQDCEEKVSTEIEEAITYSTNDDIYGRLETLEKKTKELQAKSGLYDAVLKAVLPTLTLPLQQSFEAAKSSVRQAMIQENTPQCTTLALRPEEYVQREFHNDMIKLKEDEKAFKDQQILEREDRLKRYQEELLDVTRRLKEAEDEREEAKKRALDAEKKSDRLKKEKEQVSKKLHEELNNNHRLLTGQGSLNPNMKRVLESSYGSYRQVHSKKA